MDLWWSGKHRHHGGNIQVVSAPDGWPLWTSPVGPVDGGLLGGRTSHRRGARAQRGEGGAEDAQRVRVVVGEVVGDARDPRVQVPAAQRLGGDDLDGGVVGHGHALAPGQLLPRELRRPVPMSLREQRVQQDGYAPVGRQPARDGANRRTRRR